MRCEDEQGRPYDPEIKKLVVRLMRALGGNISQTQQQLRTAGNLTICYPTLLRWAREAGIETQRRGRPVQSRIERSFNGGERKNTTTRKGPHVNSG